MKSSLCFLSIFIFMTAGCSGKKGGEEDGDADWTQDSVDDGVSDGTDAVPDGSDPSDVTGDGIEDGTVVCYGLGHACTTGIDCCSGFCEVDATGTYVCISKERCAGVGESCEVAADCCSLGCDGSVCIETLCLTGGSDCANDAQCCSHRCVGGSCESGGACLPVGEDCSSGGSESCCSKYCAEASDGLMRCLGMGRCRAEGEVCMEDSDCCNYQCEAGFCLVLPECDVAGEACDNPRDCCSGVCADDGSGFRSCQFLGGCRPFGELCRSDAECCNNPAYPGPGVCLSIAEGIGRCENPEGCAPAGELCGEGYHECCPCAIPQSSPGCPNESGDEFCQLTMFGVYRCFSGDCVIDGGECETDEDCCSGVCVDGRCGPGFECLEDLQPCAFADQCCCAICAPDETGVLVCCPGETPCIPEGGACTTDADCCSGNCNLDGICGPDENPCVPVGGACTTHEDCCSGYCSPTTNTCGGVPI